MKNLLLILICFPLFFTTCKPQDDMSGIWINKGGNFESVLTLERLSAERNVYNFTFDSWILLYDHFLGDTTKFTGSMSAPIFTIEIKDNKAYYNDDIQEFEEGWSLYEEGEDRCDVYFEFKKKSILVKTDFCSFIYGGFGVSFDGEYKKTNSQ